MDAQKIARVRSEIENGTYLTKAKMDAAMDAVISSELGLDNHGNMGYTSDRIDEQPSRSSVQTS
jgi:hypothetical protein